MGTRAPSEPLVSSRNLRGLAFHLSAHGVNPVTLAAEHGVPGAVLLDSEGRVTHAQLVALWEAGEQRLGDPDLGLHVTESADVRLLDLKQQPSDYLLLQLLATSRDVGQGLARVARYFPVVHGLATAELREHSTHADLLMTLGPGVPLAPQFIENVMSTLARLIWFATGETAQASLFFFRHPPRGSEPERTRILKAPVKFDALHDGFRLPAAHLRRPLAGAQPVLLRTVERRAEQLLSLARQGDTLVRELHAWLEQELRQGTPSAERAAEHFGVSVRTMARWLSARGTSHQRLLDDVRRELSMRYLLDTAFTITEVAALVGFAEASTFDRAFRRWSGVSPGDYRAAELKRDAC